MVEHELANHKWYHGLLAREDLRALLRNNGDFLVRLQEPTIPGKREFVLSVMWNKDSEKGIKHFAIEFVGSQFMVESTMHFNSLESLITHYVSSQQSLCPQANVVLKKAIERRPWQLNHRDIECEHKLGDGAFGEVFKGKLKRERLGRAVDVAIKLASMDNMLREHLMEFMREVRLMRHFDNPYVVRSYGMAAGEEPLMLVMELASNGSLDGHLQKVHCCLPMKLEMCLQASIGLEYLHKIGVLHRDVALHNCLYGDGKVKIAGFGLARRCSFFQMNPRNRVPIRWLAVETMRTAMFSQKTDVWSFGILSWEIFHNGAEPYPGMTVAEVCNGVKQGHRMNLDDVIGLAPEVVSLIESCWATNPNERKDMACLSRDLERITGLSRVRTLQDLAREAVRRLPHIDEELLRTVMDRV